MSPAQPPQALATARRALSMNRPDEAEAACRSLLMKDPTDPTAKALLWAVAFQRGDASGAISGLQEIIRSSPNCFDAFFWLGVGLRTTRRYEECLDLSKTMASKWPRSADAHNNVGLCLLELDRPMDAQAAFEQTVGIAPQVPKFHHNVSLALMRQGRLPEAERSARRALELAPNAFSENMHLAQILTSLNRDAEAAPLFRRSYDLEPTTNRGRTALARAQILEKDHASAEKTLRGLVEEFPTDAGAYSLLGMVLQVLGRFEEASEVLRRSIELDPNQVRSYRELALGTRFKESDRDFLQKVDEAKSLPDLRRDSRLGLHYLLGKAYDDLREYELAIAEYDDANRIARQIAGKASRKEEHVRREAKLVETFTPPFFESHRHLGSPSELPVFIVGMIRSGTTLTEQVLSSHPQVRGAGELTFWTTKGADVFLEPSLSSDESARQAQREYLAILEEHRDGCLRVTDKMPTNFETLGQIRTLFPNARIIHCLRHPVDTCVSMYVTAFKGGLDVGHDRGTIVAFYRHYQRVMEHFRQVIPSDRLLEIRYEELVQDREAVARGMIEFCGLEWDDACLTHESNERVVDTPSVWQARQPMYSTSMGRWRNYAPWLGEFRELLTESELASL